MAFRLTVSILLHWFALQACLGVNAKDERNVVNLTANNGSGESITQSILSMKMGIHEQASAKERAMLKLTGFCFILLRRNYFLPCFRLSLWNSFLASL